MNLLFTHPGLTSIALRDYYATCVALAKKHLELVADAYEMAERELCVASDPVAACRATLAAARAKFELEIACDVTTKWAREYGASLDGRRTS